jgi:hypothetical protein
LFSQLYHQSSYQYEEQSYSEQSYCQFDIFANQSYHQSEQSSYCLKYLSNNSSNNTFKKHSEFNFIKTIIHNSQIIIHYTIWLITSDNSVTSNFSWSHNELITTKTYLHVQSILLNQMRHMSQTRTNCLTKWIFITHHQHLLQQLLQISTQQFTLFMSFMQNDLQNLCKSTNLYA